MYLICITISLFIKLRIKFKKKHLIPGFICSALCRSARAVKAAVICVKRAVHNLDPRIANPRVVLVSDTPSFIKEITPNLTEFADVSESS